MSVEEAVVVYKWLDSFHKNTDLDHDKILEYSDIINGGPDYLNGKVYTEDNFTIFQLDESVIFIMRQDDPEGIGIRYFNEDNPSRKMKDSFPFWSKKMKDSFHFWHLYEMKKVSREEYQTNLRFFRDKILWPVWCRKSAM